MNGTEALPPGIHASDRLVLFDGVCKLCSAWAKFLIKYDRKLKFKLATVQSPEGQAVLSWYGLPTDIYETMLLVEGAKMYTKSAAIIRVVAQLPFPWPVVAVIWVVPVFLRDWLYDRIALNRYALFGRYNACVVPTKDHEARYLDANDL